MLRRTLIFAVALMTATVVVAPVQAELILSAGNRTLYDDISGLTWTMDANLNGLMDWGTASTWADNLTVLDGAYSYDDWRLPALSELEALESQLTFGVDWGFGTVSSTESATGDIEPTNWPNFFAAPPLGPGPYLAYWSGDSVPGDASSAYAYFFSVDQVAFPALSQGFTKGTEMFSLAVREPIPEPATILLLGTGLVGAAGVARRRRRG